MTKIAIDRWLEAAVADAERRGLPDLKPLLEGLAASTTALRAAPFGDRADRDHDAPVHADAKDARA